MILLLTSRELERVARSLVEFTDEMFGGLARSDQRVKGELYVRGLLLNGRRKSMQAMAAQLGVDHQRLQQFVTSSTWDYEDVRSRLAWWAEAVVEPEAYVVCDAGFVKEGSDSPGVARMYSRPLGGIANCQIGVGLHAATYRASIAINWGLFIPESWDDRMAMDPDVARQIIRSRDRSKIPAPVRHQKRWQLALAMIDQVVTAGAGAGGGSRNAPSSGLAGGPGWGLPARLVIADADYGNIAAFREGLLARDLPTLVAVDGSTRAYPDNAGPAVESGRRPESRMGSPAGDPVDLAALARTAGRSSLRTVTWHEDVRSGGDNVVGTASGFMAQRVRVVDGVDPQMSGRRPLDCWLLVEWPPGEPRPTGYWLCTLPTAAPLGDLVRAVEIRRRVASECRVLRRGLGLDHFEGRSYPGWHRHVTLVALAHAFCIALRAHPGVEMPR